MKIACTGVLLDVDGVLLDSIPAYERAWRVWANEHGVSEDAIWTIAHGRRPVDIIRLSAPALDEQTVLHRFEELIAGEYGRVQAMPGARDLLDQLSGAWAVVTSGTRADADRIFFRLGLPLPPVGVYGTDVVAGKPDPACYRLAAQRLDVEPRSCVVVEDAPNGVAAGKAVGMTVLAVTTTHTEWQLQQADCILPSLHAVAAALTGVAG